MSASKAKPRPSLVAPPAPTTEEASFIATGASHPAQGTPHNVPRTVPNAPRVPRRDRADETQVSLFMSRALYRKLKIRCAETGEKMSELLRPYLDRGAEEVLARPKPPDPVSGGTS
jgi:hypothetical protein